MFVVHLQQRHSADWIRSLLRAVFCIKEKQLEIKKYRNIGISGRNRKYLCYNLFYDKILLEINL